MVQRLVLSILVAVALGGAHAEGATPSGSSTSFGEIRGLISAISREVGIEERLVHAIVSVESDYDPRAVSRRGALGLMQLMPATAERLRVTDPFDPEQNLRGGVRELARLIDRFAGDLVLALAAYNAGETAVARHGGGPPYRETRDYVVQVMSLYTGRSFSLASRRVRHPVRLLRQGTGGRIVITNLPAGAQVSRPTVTVTTPTGVSRRPVLKGGFGG